MTFSRLPTSNSPKLEHTHLVWHSKIFKGHPNPLDKRTKAATKQSDICVDILVLADSFKCKTRTRLVVRFPGVHCVHYK